MTNGALIHCASSVVTKLDIYTGLIETYCAGSTSTDSNTPGVTETTSLWPATESPVTYGNWGYYTGVTEGLSTYNSTLAAYNLAGSFYTAFSSLCTNTGTPIITTTTTTSWNTFATLPGGATGTMSTMAQEATYYKCDGEKTMSVAPWWIDSNGGIDESGTLAVSIIDSLYSIENLDTWLWTLAFRYAHATVSSATNQTIWSSSNNGGSETSESSEFPVFRVPTQVQLIYGDSLNSGVGLERLTGKAVFEMSAEEELACEIAEEIAMAFEMLLAFAAGPEAEAVGIAISDGVREAVQDGIDTSRFFLGCPSDED
ncbi:hypothetical protein N7510_000110 [Penicillium lagena]|uniref:uncharacterized protein n=1 Tax=Penicillium lagena TaxID=94218 RepID=UPI0025402B1C|nr:uncharacterized protein N7510_000110 [Penicillium lagena]KAJ5623801.1 hypothetical protein N7510_000110 [Penicillium lagena]